MNAPAVVLYKRDKGISLDFDFIAVSHQATNKNDVVEGMAIGAKFVMI